MKNYIIFIIVILTFSCGKNVEPKTYCWEITSSCDYLVNGNPKISTSTECNGTEPDMAELKLELEKYGCTVTYKKK